VFLVLLLIYCLTGLPPNSIHEIDIFYRIDYPPFITTPRVVSVSMCLAFLITLRCNLEIYTIARHFKVPKFHEICTFNLEVKKKTYKTIKLSASYRRWFIFYQFNLILLLLFFFSFSCTTNLFIFLDVSIQVQTRKTKYIYLSSFPNERIFNSRTNQKFPTKKNFKKI